MALNTLQDSSFKVSSGFFWFFIASFISFKPPKGVETETLKLLETKSDKQPRHFADETKPEQEPPCKLLYP